MGASTAGYCTGNLLMEDHPLPGEDPSSTYPPGLAAPLQVCCPLASRICTPLRHRRQSCLDPALPKGKCQSAGAGWG